MNDNETLALYPNDLRNLKITPQKSDTFKDALIKKEEPNNERFPIHYIDNIKLKNSKITAQKNIED